MSNINEKLGKLEKGKKNKTPYTPYKKKIIELENSLNGVRHYMENYVSDQEVRWKALNMHLDNLPQYVPWYKKIFG